MIEIGNTLREARTRQGLTIHDAEEATKIRTRYLQALEQEDYEVIPGSTFVMGFMRTYASYLGLDADALVEEYISRYDPGFLDAHRIPPTKLRSRRSSALGRRSNYVLVAIVALVIILLLAWIGWGNRRNSPATMEATTAVTTTQSGRSVTTGGSSSGQGVTTSLTSAESASGTAATGELTVVVKAQNDRCYLIVREDSAAGKTLYAQTLDENETVSFTAAKVLWMNIANPSALVMEINGRQQEVPEPYGTFRVTAAGLERL